MTIKEALKAKSDNLSVSDGKLDLVLYEAKLDSAKVYDVDADAKDLDMAYVTLLLESITITELKEDDVSIKYSSDLRSIVSAIMRKWGLKDPFLTPKPTVTQINLY